MKEQSRCSARMNKYQTSEPVEAPRTSPRSRDILSVAAASCRPSRVGVRRPHDCRRDCGATSKPKGQSTGNNAILMLSRTIKTLSDFIFLEGAPEDAR